MNPDLEKERKNASFKSEDFARWFYDGEMRLQMKRSIEKDLFGDSGPNHDACNLSYVDMCTSSVEKSVHAATEFRKMMDRINPSGSEIYPLITGVPIELIIMASDNPFSAHIVLFTKAINGQGTREQYEKFGRRAENCEIIGTYAQTELGHGTFLRGLETRADYDRKTDEFVLNTPTLTSYKWWPGGLGHIANFCIVVAQLYIDNEPKGVQLFVVQLRDEETHMPLPGIDIGEIGKKIGMLGMNNGYLGLKNVRIPRTNMLMKNAQVLPDGTFVKSPVAKLTYFPIVYARCLIALKNSILLAQAATIATRYSAVRRQSPIDPDQPEPQVIDHITQQMKVFPEIAAACAYRVSADYLSMLYNQTTQDINKKDYSRLPELHALACILKVSCSYDSTFGIERLRQSCGGHGYLVAANLGNIFTSATAACTYEGENTVLYMQVGKILMKTWADVLAGNELMPTMSYLSECAALRKFPRWDGSWECLVRAVQFTCANKTRVAFKSLNERLNQGQQQAVAINNTALELTQAAELHGRAFTTSTFLNEVTGPNAANRPASLQSVLQNLLELYLVQTVMRHMGDILRFIDITDRELSDLQARLEEVLRKLRPDAVAICDGFDFHDRVLNSVLGTYDGNVYEHIFASAKESPMNQQPVPKSFNLYLKPFMKSRM